MTIRIHSRVGAIAASSGKALLAVMFALAATAVTTTGPASAQTPVNIVYPINGASYPITDPAPGGLHSAYFTASFSVTCQGDHKVDWGFDGSSPVGSESFYDQTSVQFVHKLPGGGHVFWVRADKGCGSSEVKFQIGK